MRITKSAYEHFVACECGCEFYARAEDFVVQMYTCIYVRCPQCGHEHHVGVMEYDKLLKNKLFNLREVEITCPQDSKCKQTSEGRSGKYNETGTDTE